MVNLWRLDEGIRQFVLSKRLGKVAADLLGVANVRIYHDHALFKEAGGRATYWHQDQYYWPLDTADTITMAMSLTDLSIGMGMFVFATGSHKLWNGDGFQAVFGAGQPLPKIYPGKSIPAEFCSGYACG